MADVTIERLTITIDLDGDGAEAHFGRLFQRHVQRWWQAECQRKSDRRFAEQERLLPDSAPGGGGGS